MLSTSILAFAATSVQAAMPAVTIGSANLVTPADALTYYGSPVSPAPGSARDPVVQEMARSLRYDVDLIYEYVHDNVEFVPLFGLQKGARGIFFDRAGTAFDQAHMMVEALREADAVASKGYNPKYRVGTVTLTGAQFASWFGVSNADAARKILADGGIPATVTSSGASLTSVTMLHIWVEATIGGVAYAFDPAFKGHNFTAPANLPTAMGYNGTDLLNAGGTGATYDATSILAFNTPAFRAKLDQFRATLEAWLATNARGAQADVAIGGKDIIPHAPTDLRRTNLPYVTSSDRLWTGNIPSGFRSALTVSVNGNTYGTYYADDTYGYLLKFAYTNSASGVIIGGQTSAISGMPGQCDQELSTATTTPAIASVSINHPYAASGGAYMDRVLSKQLVARQCTISAFYITNDWGVSTGGVRDKLNSATSYLTSSPAFREVVLSTTLASVSSQYSQYLELVGNQLKLGYQLHDMIGLHHIDAMGNENKTTNSGSVYSTVAPAQLISSDFEAGVSVNPIDALSDARRRSGAQLAASGLAYVESGVVRQEVDAERDLTSLTLFTDQNALSSTPGNYRHYLATATNWATVRDTNLQQYPANLKTILNSYIAEGYNLFLPQRGDLRQGEFSVAIGGGATRKVSLLEASSPSANVVQRPTFFAFKPAGTNQIDAAAFLIYDPRRNRVLKGGVTVQLADAANAALKEPTQPKPAEPNAVFSTFSVGLQSGRFLYSPPADIIDGSGDFPYELAYRRQYRQADYSDRGLGRGWRHNWYQAVTLSNEGGAALGSSGAQGMAATLVSIQAASDLLSVDPTPIRLLAVAQIQKWSADQTINNMAVVDSGLDSPTTFLRQGDGSFVPAKLGGGVLVQQGSPSDSLINRRIYQDVAFNYTGAEGSVRQYAFVGSATPAELGEPVYLAELARKSLHMSNWTFADGFKISMTYAHNSITDSIYPTLIQNSLGRSLTNTAYDVGDLGGRPICHGPNSFPTYTTPRNGEVRYKGSGAGETIFTKTAAPKFSLMPGVDPETVRCDANGQIQTRLTLFATDLISATDLSTKVWRYTTGPIPDLYGSPTGLTQIFLPSQTTTPAANLSFGVDNRVRAITDALARVHEYRAMPSRGDSETPLHEIDATYFDRFSRKSLTVDPLGRKTAYQYDVQDRLIKVIFPELNAEEYAYDIRGNQISKALKAKPGPVLADIVTSTAYGEGVSVATCISWKICNKPLYDIDARAQRTDYAWNSTTGNLDSITKPADENGIRPVTSYGYTSFPGANGGTFTLPTSQTEKISTTANLVTSFGYDSGNKYALKEVVADVGGRALRTCLRTDSVGEIISTTAPKADLVTCP